MANGDLCRTGNKVAEAMPAMPSMPSLGYHPGEQPNVSKLLWCFCFSAFRAFLASLSTRFSVDA